MMVSMKLLVFLPILIGLASVLQGALNRKVAAVWGLTPALAFNTAVLSVALLVYGLWERAHPEAAFIRGSGFSWSGLRWWYFLPGLFGLVLILGIPFGISRLGAASVFVGIVAAQIVGSLAWDVAFEAKPLTLLRAGGAALAIVGAWIASKG
jgi:transporter family-2 protein